jgi:hypothetical protein
MYIGRLELDRERDVRGTKTSAAQHAPRSKKASTAEDDISNASDALIRHA